MSSLNLITDLVSKFGSKGKAKAVPPQNFHPLRNNKSNNEGLSIPINDKNIKPLKAVITRLAEQDK